ncbi:MAG: electron transfer flavoprotein subunit beta/FixA family protein [Thermoplasmatota archaeon]
MPNIAVFIKPVPSDLNLAVSRRTGEPILEGVHWIINRWEKRAIELALTLRDASPGSTVTVSTMDEPSAAVALREGLAMGADKAVLLADKSFEGADTLATARVLAAGSQKMRADLIVLGGRTADRRAAGVGPMVAQLLNVPAVTFVTEAAWSGRNLHVKKRFGHNLATYEVPLPAVLSVSEEFPRARIATAWGVSDAFREKDIVAWNRRDLDLHEDSVGKDGSPTRVRRFEKIGGERKDKIEVEYFEGDAEDIAKDFVRRLKARGGVR